MPKVHDINIGFEATVQTTFELGVAHIRPFIGGREWELIEASVTYGRRGWGVAESLDWLDCLQTVVAQCGLV